MLFTRWFLQLPKTRHKYGSVAEKTLRSLLMLLFIAGLAAAFWANSDRYVQDHKSKSRLSDESALLDDATTKRVIKLITEAETKYGAKFYIKLSPLPITSTDATPGGVFMGLCPNIRQTVLLMPDSWRAYLGEGFVIRLKDEVMHGAYTQNKWQEGMIRVLEMINARIEEVVTATPADSSGTVSGKLESLPEEPEK